MRGWRLYSWLGFVVQVEGSDSSSSSVALLKVRPTSSSQSPAHLLHPRGSASSTSSSKQRRYSEQGRTISTAGCDAIYRGQSRIAASISPPVVSPASSAAPPPRRCQTSAEGEVKQDVGGQNRKSCAVEGGSPLLGNANNPNLADIPERRKTSAPPTVSCHVTQVKHRK